MGKTRTERINFMATADIKERAEEVAENTGTCISELARRGLAEQVISLEQQGAADG